MLSENTLRLIENIDREQIERRVRKVFEYWAQGDLESVIACLAPDVRTPANGFWTGLKAPRVGRAAVVAFLRETADAFENIVSILHELVIDGDRVVVHRTAVGRRRETGRRYQCDVIEFFRFRDGLIVEYSSYPDAAWTEVEA